MNVITATWFVQNIHTVTLSQEFYYSNYRWYVWGVLLPNPNHWCKYVFEKNHSTGLWQKTQKPMTPQNNAAQTTPEQQQWNVIQSQMEEFQFTQQQNSWLDRDYFQQEKVVFCSIPVPSKHQPLVLWLFFLGSAVYLNKFSGNTFNYECYVPLLLNDQI